MRYLGGKVRTAKRIAATIAERVTDDATYYEPFLGGGSVAAAVAANGCVRRLHLSDVHPDLIELWQAVLVGWEPPTAVSRDEYEALRHAEPSAMRGFVGFAVSYQGKWWGGYGARAESAGRDYVAESARALLHKAAPLRALGEGVSVRQCSYVDIAPMPGDVIYLDPPYGKSTGYGGTESFDHAAFWAWATEWSQQGVNVLVSEFAAPEGWVPVWQVNRPATVDAHKTRTSIESLYVYREAA
jgi:DNA adenine methylase